MVSIMPNGSQGSREAWERASVSRLREIDVDSVGVVSAFVVSVDRHGVLNLEAPGLSPAVSRYYWRLVDPRFSLVEIGIDRVTGRLLSLCVPLFNGTVQDLSYAHPPVGDRVAPVFDLASWKEVASSASGVAPTVDLPGRCRLEVGSSCIRVELFDEVTEHWAWPADNVAVELNAVSELIAVRILGLSESQSSTVTEYLGLSQGPTP